MVILMIVLQWTIVVLPYGQITRSLEDIILDVPNINIIYTYKLYLVIGIIIILIVGSNLVKIG